MILEDREPAEGDRAYRFRTDHEHSLPATVFGRLVAENVTLHDSGGKELGSRMKKFRLWGRERELADIDLLLKESDDGILWIVGLPGVGKSALVRHLAAHKRRESWVVFGYSSTPAESGSHGDMLQSETLVVSLSQALSRLCTDLATHWSLEPTGGALVDDLINALSSSAKPTWKSEKILILLDGLDELVVDRVGIQQLISISMAIDRIVKRCCLIVSARHGAFEDLQSIVATAGLLELKGLELGPFQGLVSDLGVEAEQERIIWLHDESQGLPLVPVLLSKMMSLGRVALDRHGVKRSLFLMHEEYWRKISQRLSESDLSAAKEILLVVTVCREPPSIQTVFHLARRRGALEEMRLPSDLIQFLRRSRVGELFCQDQHVVLSEKRLEFFHATFRDYLATGYFDTKHDILAAHSRLAESFRSIPDSFGQRHVIYHAIKSIAHDRQQLGDVFLGFDWGSLFDQCLFDDWSASGNLLQQDLIELFHILPGKYRQAVATRIDAELAQLDSSKFIERVRLEEVRGIVVPYLGAPNTTGHCKMLRLVLDVWPGYFPIFAIEEELVRHGIYIRLAEGSTDKVDQVLGGHADLIGTTPGCLTGLELEKIVKCRVMGALNRSCGADQILVDSRRVALNRRPDGGCDLEDPRELVGQTAVVTKSSTGHMFFLYFLRSVGVDPSEIEIEFSNDYSDTALLAARNHDVCLASTWEPWASSVRSRRAHLEVLYDSSRDPAVVYDLLVAHRDRAVLLDDDPRIAIFWALLDDCIENQHYLDLSVVERIVQRFKFPRRWYEDSVKKIHFFDKEERRRFVLEKERGLVHVFGHIVDTWVWGGYSPAGSVPRSAWLSALEELPFPPSQWLTTNLEFQDLSHGDGILDTGSRDGSDSVAGAANEIEQGEVSGPGMEIFISYSRQDRKILDRLRVHLQPLERQEKIRLWIDTRMEAGAEYRREIEAAIDRADCAVLLVSADFLASDFISQYELPSLLAAVEERELRIFWVPARASVPDPRISKFHALWDPGQPLDNLPAAKREAAFAKIAAEIGRALFT